MNAWATGLGAITLFVEDIEPAKSFYTRVFQNPIIFEDDASAGFRSQLTIFVDDVDRVCQEITSRGATLINGPMNRPWGVRTACFADPDGHVWEVAQSVDAN